jgi:hypothetical protein
MSDDVRRPDDGRDVPPAPRKPYRRPTVIRYGDVTTLTRNGTVGGKNDKGSGSKTRTT